MRFTIALVAGLAAANPIANPIAAAPRPNHSDAKLVNQIQLDPRPYYLVEDMDEGSLKKLQSCSEKKMKPSDWSIGYRGGGVL